MSENTNRSIALSSSTIAHELTMLYLKHQDLSTLSVSELAKKYTDTKNQFSDALYKQDFSAPVIL